MPTHPTALGHVAFYLPSLHGGGAERFAVLLAGELARRGVRVDFLLCHFAGVLCRDLPAGTRVTELGSTAIRRKLPAVCRYLTRERPQAVITSLDASNAVGLARRLTGAPARVVMVLHNTLSEELRTMAPARRRLFRLTRHLYPLADDFVAVSEGVARDAAELLPRIRPRLHTVYNPVVHDGLLAAARAPLDHPWLRPGEPPVVLGVGRLEPQKDYPTLLRAFRAVRDRRPARLVILGEGAGREALTAEVRRLGLADDVALPGFDPNPYAWMARAAVFALSSAWEGLGNVLIEALAVGTPVVSTDCPHGPREILDHGRYGRLVPVGDAAALAAALLAALAEARRPDVLAARGAAFSVARAADAYTALILHGLRGGAPAAAPFRARAALAREA
jgi:glycosyltransferase involved in cell wall biosynthesis